MEMMRRSAAPSKSARSRCHNSRRATGRLAAGQTVDSPGNRRLQLLAARGCPSATPLTNSDLFQRPQPVSSHASCCPARRASRALRLAVLHPQSGANCGAAADVSTSSIHRWVNNCYGGSLTGCEAGPLLPFHLPHPLGSDPAPPSRRKRKLKRKIISAMQYNSCHIPY